MEFHDTLANVRFLEEVQKKGLFPDPDKARGPHTALYSKTVQQKFPEEWPRNLSGNFDDTTTMRRQFSTYQALRERRAKSEHVPRVRRFSSPVGCQHTRHVRSEKGTQNPKVPQGQTSMRLRALQRMSWFTI